MSDIELVVKSGEPGFQPEPGAYICSIERIEKIDTRLGEALRIWVKSPAWPTEWGFVCSMRLSRKSKLGALLEAAGFELTPGQRINLRDVVGAVCGISIYRDSKGFARPSGFFPVSRGSKEDTVKF